MSTSPNHDHIQGTAAGGGPGPGPPSVTSSSSSAGVGPSIPVAATATKRNRIRLSCTTCRDKKLKCNRDQPCDQCEKRGIQNTCVYIPYRYPRGPQRATGPAPRAGRSSGGSNEAVLQEQNRHLKEVVQRLSAELAKRGGRPVSSDGSERPGTERDGGSATEEIVGDSPDTVPAGALMNERYIDDANWEAISDDVTKLLDDLKTEDDYEEETYVELETQQGAALVLGGFIPMTPTELFTWLPPPNITTWLMTRFFKGKEPAWLVFHVPTFWKQYHAFWQSPSTFPIAWYALLSVMISHAANFCLRADEDIPGGIGTAQEVSDCWRINCAHCLAIDDYTKPGKFKVETLLLYFGAEYLRVRDAQRGTSILLTIACRLAMHMGLHRDASHYKEISTYEGEMRRRLWTVLTEIDCLVTFQFGTPLNIQSQYCDTKLPSNLRDEDFNESTEVLPMERPLTERTPALYTIVKSRIVKAMADIVARMQSNVSPTYGEVMRLDKQLSDAHDAIPPVLRARPFKLSQEDPIDLIMQRLWIELMYLKSRIVLHRRYFTLGRNDLSFRHSTHACMQAATATLEHQLEAHIEIQPGGRLAKEQWFLSSLSIHDFLLADMIVCLEISCILRDHNALGAPPPRDGWDPELRQLLHIIKVSRQIWAQARKESQEANRAYKILGRMMQTAMGDTGDPDLELTFEPVDLRAPPSYHFTGAPSSPYHPQQAHHVPGLMPSIGTTLSTSWAALVPPGLVGTVNWPVVEGPEVYGAETSHFQAIPQGIAMDWSNWDTQIQNTDAEMLQISWANFFGQGLHE